MARAGVTYEQVATIADRLSKAGQTPTIRALREELGDTGSPNTIHRHLNVWRERQPAADATQAALPQGLISAIAAEIKRATAQARVELEERLARVQTEANELARAGEDLEKERDEVAMQLADVTSERDRFVGQLEQQASSFKATEERLRADLITLQQERIGLEQQVAVLQAKLELSETSANAAEARTQKLEQTLESEREKHHASLSEVREEVARLKGQVDTLRQTKQS